MSKKPFIILLIMISTFCLNMNNVQALSPSQVEAGIWVISVDKVDLASGTFQQTFISGSITWMFLQILSL